MRDPIHPTRTRAEIAADNQAEMEGWIDERAAALAAGGLDPEEARRRALQEFGDVGAAAGYARRQDLAADRRFRALRWAEELGSDLRIALRTLVRTPTVTAVVLLTFALGIGVTTAVFSLVHALLLRPLPYGDEPTLVYFQALDRGVIGPNPRFSAAVLAALQERTTSFTGITSVEMGNFVLTENGDPEQISGAELPGNAFDILRVTPALGRLFGPNDVHPTTPVLILGDELWRRRFAGDPDIVGRMITMGDERWQVIGVMPPGVRVPTYEQAQFWQPRDWSSVLANQNARHVRAARLFGRLRPGVTVLAAQADVNRAMGTLQTEFPQQYSDVDARILPVRTALAGSTRPRLLVLMGAAGFVLLIACANVAGVLLARALARRHELTIRVALGAGRRRLIRQFLAEGAALALLGAGLGVVVAQLGILVLRRSAASSLPPGTTFALEPRVLLFALGAAFTGALLSSLVPALSATRGIGIALRQDQARISPSRSARRMRLGLVAGQLAVAVVLLVGAGLLVRTLHRLAELDLGYDTERALTFRVQFTHPKSNPEQNAFWSALYADLRALPGVMLVGGGSVPLSGQSSIVNLEIEGRQLEPGHLPQARNSPASDDYFSTLGIPILRGRGFGPEDRDSAPWVALVSTGLARQLWPGADPIGTQIRTEPNKPWATIVGLVGDVRMGGADEPVPSVYTSQRQDHWRGGGTVVLRVAGDPLALAAGVRRVVRSADSTLPIIGLRSMEEFRRATPAIAERRMQLQLMLIFALAALAVSAIGVYGVGAYAAEARRREFGIRIALGARRSGVLWLALREGAQVGALGALVGVPLAWLLAARLQYLWYAVTPFDPFTTGTVVGALLLVVLAASLVPARRATLIDPVTTMRAE